MKKRFEKDRCILDKVKDIVKEWIEDENAREGDLFVRLALLLGERAGRLLSNIFMLPPEAASALFEYIERLDGDSDLVRRLRDLAQQLYPAVAKKMCKLVTPFRAHDMEVYIVDHDPLILRIEADTCKDGRVVVELDEEDLMELLNKISIVKSSLLLKALDGKHSREEDADREQEDVLGARDDIEVSSNVYHI